MPFAKICACFSEIDSQENHSKAGGGRFCNIPCMYGVYNIFPSLWQ
jgi:hypothetical protein